MLCWLLVILRVRWDILDALGNFRVRCSLMHPEITVPYFLSLWTRRAYFQGASNHFLDVSEVKYILKHFLNFHEFKGALD